MTKFKSLKKLAALSAVAAMCGFAKAEKTEGFENIEALPNGQVLVHNTDTNGVANIGGVKVPFMFVENDLRRGFAPKAIENATEVVVDKTGTNAYANVQGLIKNFTITKSGIPSTQINEYGLLNEDGTTNKTAKVVATMDGALFAIDGTNIKKFEKQGDSYKDLAKKTANVGNVKLVKSDENYIYTMNPTRIWKVDKNLDRASVISSLKDIYTDFVITDDDVILSKGNKVGSTPAFDTECPIDSMTLSKDKTKIFVASGATNIVKVVDAKDTGIQESVSADFGIKKVIDNPENNRKMIYVTNNKLKTIGY